MLGCHTSTLLEAVRKLCRGTAQKCMPLTSFNRLGTPFVADNCLSECMGARVERGNVVSALDIFHLCIHTRTKPKQLNLTRIHCVARACTHKHPSDDVSATSLLNLDRTSDAGPVGAVDGSDMHHVAYCGFLRRMVLCFRKRLFRYISTAL